MQNEKASENKPLKTRKVASDNNEGIISDDQSYLRFRIIVYSLSIM